MTVLQLLDVKLVDVILGKSLSDIEKSMIFIYKKLKEYRFLFLIITAIPILLQVDK